MNPTQDTIKLAHIRAQVAEGLISIIDQMSRLDGVIARGGMATTERRDLWRLETEQAGLTTRQTIIADQLARDLSPSVVLVVEDDALVLMATVADLEAAGFTVIEASNADEGLALLETHGSICSVFTDVQMPGTMDGLTLARVVHARWPLIRMIITSGNTDFGLDDLTLGDGFLRKPYRAQDIVAALRAN